ncbi:ATP-binding protein [Pedobacter gandavensis]|uniref:histidine kinase n=1 Tax=Pedobacter gandavensis TaxID=2679963 RepID=A0ABR6EUU7_9SPHI|nr:ATP-binding protein [Pedobacter gandavensis]MBB2149048.1 response regulator [Pedobacter gandavensis]
MKNKQRSFLLISAVIILFIGFLFRNSVVQRGRQSTLVSSLKELEDNSLRISKLDTITLSLQTAENNFRMYTTLWDTTYFKKYTKDILLISSLLKELSTDDSSDISGTIVGDLKNKRGQMTLYGELKRLTDSLNNINVGLELLKITGNKPKLKSFPKVMLKKVTKVEESIAAPAAPRQKLFKRLKNAITNKEARKDSTKRLKTEITYEETAPDVEAYNKKQLENIESFYVNLFDDLKNNRKVLTKKEEEILKLNENIFQNIKRLFQEFRNREGINAELKKAILKSRANTSLTAMERSRQINFWISVLSYFAIILLMWKLYRAYDKTLRANQLAAEQVVIKSRFFTSISHEMRTPLNAIIGVSEQLKSTPLNEDQQQMSKLLDNSSSMLLSAVNEVLDFSRLETGKLALAKTPFRYKKILADIAATARILADEKDLVLELVMDDAPDLLLDGDPYRLKQMVMNLIANAIKFTDKGKVSIQVSLKKADEKHITLFIKVKDTGIGISSENLPLIFNEFSQVINSKRSDWQKGSGLGLAISKKLVEMHKGKISVESTLGKGSTFTLEIPYVIAEKDSEELDAQQAPVINSDRFKNLHLLVVDDSDMNLLVIKMIFKKIGISFDTAHNGHEALNFLESNRYDMVLTDIQMPEMDGIELTKRIRALDDQQKSQLPVIAITGQITSDSHERYLSAGLNDYIIKPFTESELMEKILDYLK